MEDELQINLGYNENSIDTPFSLSVLYKGKIARMAVKKIAIGPMLKITAQLINKVLKETNKNK